MTIREPILTMTRTYYTFIAIVLGLHHDLRAQSSDNLTLDKRQAYAEAKFKNINWTETTICEIGQLEFIDIYPNVDSISDKHERLEIVEKLESIGLTKTNWGRGNWELGPRIVSVTLTNGECSCQVDKLYYSTDNPSIYRVTERIACEPISR